MIIYLCLQNLINFKFIKVVVVEFGKWQKERGLRDIQRQREVLIDSNEWQFVCVRICYVYWYVVCYGSIFFCVNVDVICEVKLFICGDVENKFF